MNPAMKATGQHEFHPDAESLSAFAEQALGERERGRVLEHLAVCGRCRRVVALAREAADAEVVRARSGARPSGRTPGGEVGDLPWLRRGVGCHRCGGDLCACAARGAERRDSEG